ncbi:NAD(P)/FAD-dependent oxidoreductase [bacterium]|nr:NAD(P)/FAD-dependent oxidoreductase [bacterium]
MNINDVVIIGAGPAGLGTAIQLKRYGIEHILLEKEKVGGLLRNANLVENYPGFPEGIPGPELIKLFKRQIKNVWVKIQFEEVLELDNRKGVFIINTNQRTIISRFVVIASGTKPRKISSLNISKDFENRIFYEVYPLAQVANEKIAIIGSGDAAFDYALNLSKKNEVVILNRGSRVKCLPLLFERGIGNEKISYMENIQVKNIDCFDRYLVLTCYDTTGEREIYVSYLLVATGRDPCLDFLSENLIENLEKLQKSKVLHIIGDVKNDIYRQTAIAVGDGIKAAMEIYRKL